MKTPDKVRKQKAGESLDEDLVVTSCSSKIAFELEVRHTHPRLIPVAHVADVDPPTLFKNITGKLKPIATYCYLKPIAET